MIEDTEEDREEEVKIAVVGSLSFSSKYGC